MKISNPQFVEIHVDTDLEKTSRQSSLEEDPRVCVALQPGDGSASKTDCHASEMEFTHSELFPIKVDVTPNESSSARKRTAWKRPATAISISEAESDLRDPTKWTRLSRIHHDVGPEFGPSDRKSRLIQTSNQYRRYDTILSQLEIPKIERQTVLRRALNEDLRRFNRHGGVEGALLGLALFELFDDPDNAKDSSYADLAREKLPGLSDRSIRKLIEYVFRSEGAS